MTDAIGEPVERTVRQAQTIVPFGVGAVYDFRGESFVACDTAEWSRAVDLPAERLAIELGVSGFKMAPSTSGFGTPSRHPYARFPQWLFCGSCRRMVYVRRADERLDRTQTCTSCRNQPRLVPMRFVLACPKGHLGDIPWPYWAHSRSSSPNQKGCQSRSLSLDIDPRRGTGLGALTIRCTTCGASRSLQGITSDHSVQALGIKCPGRQPWQRRNGSSECPETPKVLQRGASNLYFAEVASAIDIPPDSRRATVPDVAAEIRSHSSFDVIASDPHGPIARILTAAIADELRCSEDEVRTVVTEELRMRAGGAAPSSTLNLTDRQTAEWIALLGIEPEDDHRQTFVSERALLFERPTGSLETGLDSLIGDVRILTRLREVRALTGFRRYDLENGEVVPPDLGAGLDWLPAVEVFGEGIFLTLDEQAILDWETSAEVADRVALLRRRHADSFLKGRVGNLTPRFLLVHTLAHVLLRRLAFEAGYPAASLRERVYASTPEEERGPQAGVLIYTAAGDYDGTLGGLARLGRPPRLAQSLTAALKEAMWCSSDPICIESRGQGYSGLNLGACHACCLLAETSCTHWNLMLDRGVLLGTEGSPGFFRRVVETL